MADIEASDDCENSPDNSDTTDMRLPCCLCWSVEQVGNWIDSLEYHIYRKCFTDNFITGRKLILINASALAKMGVNDFVHIKEISRAIRDLLRVDLTPWNRSIALPPREEKALFLEQKSDTGVNAEKLTFEKFHSDFELLKFQPSLCNQGILRS